MAFLTMVPSTDLFDFAWKARLSSLVLPGAHAHTIHAPLPLMSDTLVSGLIQLAISLGGAGMVVQLLLLRQNRRKIAGDASASEANAASTLSGAAVKMVENAQRAQQLAETSKGQAETRVADRDRQINALEDDGNRMRWRLHHQDMYIAILKAGYRSAHLEMPEEPTYQEFGHTPPPEIPGPNPLSVEPPSTP